MTRTTVGLLAVALSLPLAGCDDSTAVAEAGTLTLMLTDASGPFTNAFVTIKRIELVGDGQPLVLMDTPLTTDLLTLANDVVSLVEDKTVPGGRYSQLRFIIPGACINVTESGSTYASEDFPEQWCGPADGRLKLPSYDQSGIKVKLPGGSITVDGQSEILLLDFQVAESFGHKAGASDSWVMTPVIHAERISLTGSIVVELTVAETVDLAALGSSLADFEASLDTEPVPQPFTDGDGDGTYTATFSFLLPDVPHSVSVGLKGGVSFDFDLSPTSPQSVTLGSGEQKSIAFEVVSASSTP